MRLTFQWVVFLMLAVPVLASENQLLNVDTRPGVSVQVYYMKSDEDLDFSYRVSANHIEDLRHVVSFLKRDADLPIWLVGTSRGSISAAAAAIAFGNEELAGVVLTSSVTSIQKPGAVPYQVLEAIRIPVLILHHERDACSACSPQEVARITRGLKNAPVKKEVFVNGGGSPTGDPCEALHWHGFIGIESDAVAIIAGWIKRPRP